MQQPLPLNINLLTLKQLDSTNVLIRLEHIYQRNEASQTVTIDLTGILNYKIIQVQELSLAANKVLNSSGMLLLKNNESSKYY